MESPRSCTAPPEYGLLFCPSDLPYRCTERDMPGNSSEILTPFPGPSCMAFQTLARHGGSVGRYPL